jgi:fructuronate reductase
MSAGSSKGTRRPDLPRLTRSIRPSEAAPIRIVHLGLGAFHRSHQAWYTQHAGDSSEWGIASFTGRRPDAAAALSEQDGLYTLVERADGGDSFEVITSIVEAADGADVGRLAELIAARRTAVVTLTVTEAAYGLGPDGRLDSTAPAIAADLLILAAGSAAGRFPATPLGRLVLALAARRGSGAGPLAVVCCDNLAHNGKVARQAVLGMAEVFDAELAAWIRANISFVSTSVDRITPQTTDADLDAVASACGYRDESPVVTEPFRDWVLSGAFPAGRPRWEDAGATFVDDIEPFEDRKLWLLNGAHSLLAYAGQLRGHTTVAQALADPGCREAVEVFWDEAAAHLTGADLRIGDYRAALLARFGNARIAHNLAQIAMDGSTKLRLRAVPVLRAERGAGRTGAAAARMIAAWTDYTRLDFPGAGEKLADPLDAEVQAANTLPGTRRIATLLGLLDPGLGEDAAVVSLIESLCGTLTEPAVSA